MSRQVKLTETDNGVESVLWEGEYQLPDNRERSEEIRVRYPEDEDQPLFLVDENDNDIRDLSGEESDEVLTQGTALAVRMTHPRFDRYEPPLCASWVPEIHKATCGNLGIIPDPNLDFTVEDTGDDSNPQYFIRIKIPTKLKKRLDGNQK